NLFFGGKPIRNMCPVKGGSTTYGPDIYLLSNRNFAETNDTIFIMRVTGLLDDPLTTVEIDYALSDMHYAVPPQARQYNANTFDTNDGHVLGAFIENGMIQFVANTLDPSTGFSGIYHGIITDLDGERNITAQIIGDDTLDFGYPNISYTGRFDNDDQCIITMDHSAPEVFAGMSAFFYSQGNYSERVKLIDGETYVNVIGGTYERWGDYTGSQRKYNEPGVVWVSGNFGNLKDFGPFTNRENGTWIASLRSNDSLPPASVSPAFTPHNTQVFPNPADNYFETIIDVSAGGIITCKLLDIQGRLITVLLSRQINAGKNKFTFSTAPLDAGIYFLQIDFNNVPFSQTRIVKP
ncbi:MAG: T9SS type A sorting domain-containing protein, partial [Chitinophagales bacterium]